jgi:hypothetical protein
MKSLPALIVIATLASSLASIPAAGAEPAARPAANPTFAQTERKAADLKQGMSSEEVQKLLGKPRRTSLRSSGSAANGASPGGILQWTYAWTDSSQGALRIEFAAKAPAEWTVTSWDWASY